MKANREMKKRKWLLSVWKWRVFISNIIIYSMIRLAHEIFSMTTAVLMYDVSEISINENIGWPIINGYIMAGGGWRRGARRMWLCQLQHLQLMSLIVGWCL